MNASNEVNAYQKISIPTDRPWLGSQSAKSTKMSLESIDVNILIDLDVPES